MTQTISAQEYRAMFRLPAASAPMAAKARLPRPGRSYATEGMNATEAEHAAQLTAMQFVGKVVAWEYEAIKLRLADKTFYTPDFLVIFADGHIELHEVKGHWEDDARVKIKVAAAQYPWFTFKAFRKVKKQWVSEVFGLTSE